MGYFPQIIPSSGGAGFTRVSIYTAVMSSTYNGSLITTTLPADAKFIRINVQATVTSYDPDIGVMQGEAFIDLSDHSFKSVLSGSTLNRTPYEHAETESKTLLGDVPGTILDIPDHSVKITTYSGAGNSIVITGTQVVSTTLDPSGAVCTTVTMTVYRRT